MKETTPAAMLQYIGEIGTSKTFKMPKTTADMAAISNYNVAQFAPKTKFFGLH